MAQPWQVIDRADTAEGILELRRRGERDFLILIDNRVLMNSSANRSEIMLSKLACEAISDKKSPRVLMGGLGMGYSLKAALDNLPGDATVMVAELNPVVITWCRGPLAPLTDQAVDDPRVTVKISDVAAVIIDAAQKGGDERFDAIILDLYEGPTESDRERGEYLYGNAALELSKAALTPEGVFAVWSEDPDKVFERRLADRFSFDRQRPGRGGRSHVVYIARKSAAPSARGSNREKMVAGKRQKHGRK